jgi:outer membrane protein assembly factor BamB
MLYIAGFNLDPPASSLFSVRVNDGTLLWHFQLKKAALSQPQMSGTVVYVSVGDHRILAFRSNGGSLLWQTKSQSAGLAAPEVAQGGVYVAGVFGYSIAALQVSDGSPLWQTMIGGLGVSSLQVASGVMYVVDIAGRISALKGSAGLLLWQRALSGAGVGSLPSPVQVARSMLYLLDAGDCSVYGLRASDGTIRWHVMTGQPDPAVKLPLMVGS